MIHIQTNGRTAAELGDCFDALGYQIRRNARSERVEVRKVGGAVGYGEFYGAMNLGDIGAGGWTQVTDTVESYIQDEIARLVFAPKGDSFAPMIWRDLDWKRAKEALLHMFSADPFADWLDELPAWDGTPRLHEVLPTVLGGEYSEAYNRAAAELVFCGAVARARVAGFPVDSILVLIGEGGIGKSELFRRVFSPRRQSDWFNGGYTAPETPQKVVEETLGFVIVEWAELARLHTRDYDSLKANLSSRSERVRLSYRRNSQDYPRRFVIVATSNDDGGRGVLPEDDWAQRRFMPYASPLGRQAYKRGAFEWLEEKRVQLWAEAVHRWETHHSKLPAIRIPEELQADVHAERFEQRREVGAAELIAAFATDNRGDFAGLTNEQIVLEYQRQHGDTTKTLADFVGFSQRQVAMKVAAALRLREWVMRRRVVGGVKAKRWYPPEYDPKKDKPKPKGAAELRF